MKIFYLLIIFLLALQIGGHCEAPQVVIKDVRGEIFDENAEIIVEANCDIDYLDYTIQNPSQIIIDPIGKVYSDLKEVILFEKGPVKKVRIVKGRPEEGLTGNFYPLDFISIELVSPVGYKIKRERQEIIVDIGKKKKAEVVKFIPEPEQVKEEPLPPPIEEVPSSPLQETKLEPDIKDIEPRTQSIEPKAEEKPTEVIPLEGLNAPQETPVAPEPIKVVYMLGEGDMLDISVWQHPELDKKVIVRPDGYVSFPLVGDIKAAGLTPPQLASNVRENLTRLIRDPQVTVIVSGFGSKNIFVLGEVNKPGAYPYRGGINILNAISDAGGWKNSAVLNSVMLVRKAFTDAPEAHRLNVYALIKNGDFSQNLPVEPGDIVYVPKSFVANIGGFIENLKFSIGAYITESTKVFD